MNQNSSTSPASTFAPISPDAVLFQPDSLKSLELFASESEPLHQIGFTGVVAPKGFAEENSGLLDQLSAAGFTVHTSEGSGRSINLIPHTSNMSSLWTELQSSPAVSTGETLNAGNQEIGTITLLQMTSQPVPVVSIEPNIIYSSQLRQQRELLRSLVFWRKRFHIARQAPKLVHAGDEGLLIFIVDSWLLTVNQNAEEASIDLGSHGSMWLMLGTSLDVHLHGSMLILPSESGAILANELAR